MLNFIEWVQTQSEAWTQYNICHLIFIAAFLVLTVLCVFYIRNFSDKTVRVLVGVAWGVIIFFEILKQIYFNASTDGGVLSWTTQWYVFPVLFCSTPYYLFPIVAFVPDCKFRDGVISFCSTFTTIAGGLVFFFFIESCFTTSLVINIQTSLHHATMFLVGVGLSVYYSQKIKLFNFLRAIGVFGVMSAIAVFLNEVAYPATSAIGQTFNAFHISRHYACPLAVIGQFWNGQGTVLAYVGFLCIYVFGFALMGFVVFGIQFAVKKMYRKVKG